MIEDESALGVQLRGRERGGADKTLLLTDREHQLEAGVGYLLHHDSTDHVRRRRDGGLVVAPTMEGLAFRITPFATTGWSGAVVQALVNRNLAQHAEVDIVQSGSDEDVAAELRCAPAGRGSRVADFAAGHTPIHAVGRKPADIGLHPARPRPP